MRNQPSLPFGVVQQGAYSLTVKTWAEVIGDAEHRLKFVQESLNYASSRDAGLGYLREHYAEYLPAAALIGGVPEEGLDSYTAAAPQAPGHAISDDAASPEVR